MHSSTSRETVAPAHHGASLSTLTGADALFDGLVDSIMLQLCASLPSIPAKQLRARLRAFRPRFEAVYQRTLQENLGADLGSFARDLNEPRARAYFDARRSMATDLGGLMQQLSLDMGQTRF